VVLGRRVDTVHDQAGQLPELAEGGANSAASTDDEHPIARLHAASAVENLVGNQIVQDERHGGCRVDQFRYPENRVSPHVDTFGVPIDFGQHGNAIPWREASNLVTRCVNLADHRIAGHERRLLLEGTAALPGLYVNEAYTRRLHPDPNFVRPRGPQLPLDDLQHLRASPPGCQYTSIRGHLGCLLSELCLVRGSNHRDRPAGVCRPNAARSEKRFWRARRIGFRRAHEGPVLRADPDCRQPSTAAPPGPSHLSPAAAIPEG